MTEFAACEKLVDTYNECHFEGNYNAVFDIDNITAAEVSRRVFNKCKHLDTKEFAFTYKSTFELQGNEGTVIYACG